MKLHVGFIPVLENAKRFQLQQDAERLAMPLKREAFSLIFRTFTSTPVSEGVLSDLERTAAEVRWSKEPSDGETLYVLFSRSGCTEDLEHVAEMRSDVRLFDLSDLLPTESDCSAADAA